MRFELIRYFKHDPKDIVMRAKSFLTGKEIFPHQESGAEAIFYGDSPDVGMPTVGQKFILSNRYLPVASEEDRASIITSSVVWVEAERAYADAEGATQHVLDFRTKYSEYRLTWFTR